MPPQTRELLLQVAAEHQLLADPGRDAEYQKKNDLHSGDRCELLGDVPDFFRVDVRSGEFHQHIADDCEHQYRDCPIGKRHNEVIQPRPNSWPVLPKQLAQGNLTHVYSPYRQASQRPFIGNGQTVVQHQVQGLVAEVAQLSHPGQGKSEDYYHDQRSVPPGGQQAAGRSRSRRHVIVFGCFEIQWLRPSVMEDVVIVAGVRTPVGKFQGALSSFSAVQLGSLVVREALHRARLNPDQVDECIMGNVVSAGLGQNPARQAAIFAGLSPAVSAMTINKVCGSGLKAVALAAQAIQTGNAGIVIAGGMESMTNAPYLLPQGRSGFRMGNATVVDSMIHDGLWEIYNDYHMGVTGEHVAEKHGITREEQDQYALNSHRKAAAAARACYLRSQILPIEIPAKKKGEPPATLDHDESVREDASIEALRALKPAFKKDGTVTAGNAPGVNDGAAAVVVMSASKAASLGLTPMVRIRAQATSGIDPKWVMLAPVLGIQRVLAKAGWSKEDPDLYELNEAFSVQALGVMKEVGLDPAKVNVNGGAVAIGHPIGASGARVLVALIYEMVRRDAHRGVAALCLGGGNSVAMAVER